MATNKVLEVTKKLVALLDPLESGDRQRALQAAFVLLDIAPNAPIFNGTQSVQVTTQANGPKPTAMGGNVSERSFFEEKQPESKGEELAVAARYREAYGGATSSTKDELREVFKSARRNFDANNYNRDIGNARTKGLFNKGSGADTVLSHYGQNYVDALPDREMVNALKKPKGAGVKRVATKRVAKNAAKKVAKKA